MIRRILIFFLALFLFGCQGSDDVPQLDPPTPQPSNPAEFPDEKKLWGDLVCQQKGSCENGILNIEKDNLILFLKGVGSDFQGSTSERNESFFFACGQSVQRAWREFFSDYWRSNDKDDEYLRGFLLLTIELSQCQAKPNLNKLLKLYFENTKEFKNEKL